MRTAYFTNNVSRIKNRLIQRRVKIQIIMFGGHVIVWLGNHRLHTAK